MRLSTFIGQLTEMQVRYGDKPVRARHNHRNYNIADDTMAVNHQYEYVSFALDIFPVGIRETSDKSAEEMTEIVRGTHPDWYQEILMRMAAKHPGQFYDAFSEVITDNAYKQSGIPNPKDEEKGE